MRKGGWKGLNVSLTMNRMLSQYANSKLSRIFKEGI